MNKMEIAKVIILACVFVFTTQCRRRIAELDGREPSGEMIEVSLHVDCNGSKTDINELNLGVDWNVGDRLYVVGETDGYLGGYLSAQNSGSSAYFSGAIDKSKFIHKQHLHFYYIGDNSKVFTLDVNGNYTYDISSQNGSLDNIEDNFHLMHGVSDGEIDAGSTDLGNINMNSMMAIAKMKFNRGDGGVWKNTVVCKNGFSSAKLDTKNGTLTEKTTADITLNNVSNGADYCVALIPGNQTLTFEQDIMCKTIKNKDVTANTFYNNDDAINVCMDDIVGAVRGVFSVSSSEKKIRFAKGNLQWKGGGANTWKFADHQYDYVGDDAYGNVYENGTKCDNSQIAASYIGWIDMFGWGTSGYNGKYPYTMSLDNADYAPWQNITKTDYDWGWYNSISNGGNVAGKWYTITFDEWKYLLGLGGGTAGTDFRKTSTINGVENARFAKVRINELRGLLLFPDQFEWTTEMGDVPEINDPGILFEKLSEYSIEQFEKMESAGAVFLPSCGYRSGNHVLDIAMVETSPGISWRGDYYASSFINNGGNKYVTYLDFKNSDVSLRNDCNNLYWGYSVRLAIDVLPW